MKHFAFIFTLCFTFCIVTHAANNVTKLQKLEIESDMAKEHQNGLAIINAFLQEAKREKNDTCIMKAYNRKMYYYIVTMRQFKNADKTYIQLKNEKIDEDRKTMVKTVIIYCYQYVGNTVKAVDLCRELLQTSKDKKTISYAKFNIILMYYNFGMLETATNKIIELTHFTESIDDKEDYHFKLSNYYMHTAMFLVESNKPKKALTYLLKTDSVLKHDPANSASVMGFETPFLSYVWGEYYSAVNDNANFWKKIKELEKYDTDDVRRLVYELEFRYFIKRNDFAKAKDAMDKFKVVIKNLGLNFDDAGYTLINAKIARGLGDYRTAADLFQRYITENDSINKMADLLKTNEYAVQLDLDKTNMEKSELNAKVIHYKFQVLILVTCFALLAIIFAIVFIFKLRKANRKLHEANEQLNNSYKRIETIDSIKTALINNMSREIRGPLSGISGFSQVISSMGDELKEYADIIDDNSNQIEKVLDGVVASSELEKCDIELEPVNVDECCKSAIYSNKEKVPENVKLIYQPSSEFLNVNCNNRWLVEILNDLIDNACKFTKEGSITLKYSFEDVYLHISVEDTGCGIPADKAEWVFEHFTKVDKFSKGTGLGLSLCRMIALKLGGSIAVDTNYHKGCKVDVYLPCNQ
jgi:signal transduction histidine kinase